MQKDLYVSIRIIHDMVKTITKETEGYIIHDDFNMRKFCMMISIGQKFVHLVTKYFTQEHKYNKKKTFSLTS